MVAAGVNFGLDLVEEIAELKRERNAVILSHNYQVPELQDIADHVGDSVGRSDHAAQPDAAVQHLNRLRASRMITGYDDHIRRGDIRFG